VVVHSHHQYRPHKNHVSILLDIIDAFNTVQMSVVKKDIPAMGNPNAVKKSVMNANVKTLGRYPVM
jgi:hypothetical protein